MNAYPVIAAVNSRLHADVTIIRLRRIGIDPRKISAVFRQRLMPNSVACWLKFWRLPANLSGRKLILAAGPWCAELEPKADETAVADLLTSLGFHQRDVAAAAERVAEGGILLCVHAENAVEISLAWHIFRHSGATAIALSRQGVEVETEPAADPVAAWSPTAA